jgi:hypothetical protein
VAILLIGIGILGSVLGLFYLKDRLGSPTLARIAYSGLIARLALLSAAMIVIGSLLVLDKLFS